MKTTQCEPCSEASLNSELNHLREIRTNLSRYIDVLPEDDSRTKMAAALSFIQMAIDALTSFQADQVAGIPSILTRPLVDELWPGPFPSNSHHRH